MVYSRLKGPWVQAWDVKKAFFWLYRPFFGYIPPSTAKKGGIFLKRRWYVAKVVYSLIGMYDIPEPFLYDILSHFHMTYEPFLYDI